MFSAIPADLRSPSYSLTKTKMKYIRFKNRGFVLFEGVQSHAEFAKMIGDEVESAGFAHATDWCDNGQIGCSGESHTLKAHCHADDTETLRRRLSR